MKRLWLCACCALLVTAPARAQDRLGRLEPALRSSVDLLIDSARVAGLPIQPLEQKALEGVARRVPAARVIAAVAGTLARLRTAQRDLGTDASESDLVAAAAALYAGVTSDQLRLLKADATGQSIALALVTLTDLIQRGVVPEVAYNSIGALLRARVRSDAFHLLSTQVAADLRAGIRPETAIRQRMEAILPRAPVRVP